MPSGKAFECEAAADRADLREKLRVGGGGVVFTTIQKFIRAESGDRNAVLSDRRNIVVIADEAHRSPASRGRTRARCSVTTSASTTSLAVEDGATVPIY